VDIYKENAGPQRQVLKSSHRGRTKRTTADFSKITTEDKK
jgi:hypothetical protein